MPIFETQEQVDKAVSALKDYKAAGRVAEKAITAKNDKLTALKTIVGITSNDHAKIEEEVLMMLGKVAVEGLPEVR